MAQKRWTYEDLEKKGLEIKGDKAEPLKRNKYGNVKVGSNDSKSENDFARRLSMIGIKFTEKESITIFPGFVYGQEKILPIRIEPDFFIYHNDALIAIVDTKHVTAQPKKKDGTQGKKVIGTAEWRLKIKMLKKYYADQGIFIPMFFPVSKAEKETTLVQILTLIQGLKNVNTK
jgi:hypothetical protein